VLLPFTTTVAGNFTLIGSVANIIVAERARDHCALGFVEYLRFVLPSTILVLVAGVTTTCLVMAGDHSPLSESPSLRPINLNQVSSIGQSEHGEFFFDRDRIYSTSKDQISIELDG
jgi:hypothetical protein